MSVSNSPKMPEGRSATVASVPPLPLASKMRRSPEGVGWWGGQNSDSGVWRAEKRQWGGAGREGGREVRAARGTTVFGGKVQEL